MPIRNLTPLGPDADLEDIDDDEDEFFEDGDDYYDADGSCSIGGLYDAGGHVISERLFEYADDLRDRLRDER